jgi:hypothetical protein
LQQFVKEGHLRWDSLGEYLALACSLEDLGVKTQNDKVRKLADALNIATGKVAICMCVGVCVCVFVHIYIRELADALNIATGNAAKIHTHTHTHTHTHIVPIQHCSKTRCILLLHKKYPLQ